MTATDTDFIKRQLGRLEGKALLHGRTEAVEREISDLCAKLDDLEPGAGEDWLMDRDRELGRAFRPMSDPFPTPLSSG